MKKRRQQHLDVEVVHVNAENIVEFDTLGRLRKKYAHSAVPISTRPSCIVTRCTRDRPSNRSASFTGFRSSIALNSSNSMRNGSNSWLVAVYPSAKRERSSNISRVTRSVGLPSTCVSSSVSGTASIYGLLSWSDEQQNWPGSNCFMTVSSSWLFFERVKDKRPCEASYGTPSDCEIPLRSRWRSCCSDHWPETAWAKSSRYQYGR